MSDLIEFIMMAEGVSVFEAAHLVQIARNEILEGADPEDVLMDRFGLDSSWIRDVTE